MRVASRTKRPLGCCLPEAAFPASEAQFASCLLRTALDPTPMETSVVMHLRDHQDPADVAQVLGLAISTVRSHLKHAFRKTGTTRQGDLLRLVDRLLSAVPNG